MKKNLWITTASALALSFVFLLFIVACNKNSNDDDEGGGNSSIPTPTGVIAEETESMVCVYWNDVPNAYFYRVYRSDRSNGTYFWLSDVDGTMYWDEDPMTDNYYKITTVNDDGDESAKSSYAYCYCENGGGGNGGGGGGSSTIINAPESVSASVSGSRIRVSWSYV